MKAGSAIRKEKAMKSTKSIKISRREELICASKFYVTNETTYDIIKTYKRK